MGTPILLIPGGMTDIVNKNCAPAKEGGERSERALASVALAEEGGCSLARLDGKVFL